MNDDARAGPVHTIRSEVNVQLMSTHVLSANRLSRICVGLFAVSAMFPIVASVYPPAAPGWLGVADVLFAALLMTAAVAVAMQIQSSVNDEDRLSAFRTSQAVFSAIPVLLLVFFIAGSRIKWDVLVIGLAWRAWLLLYTLPSLIAAYRQP